MMMKKCALLLALSASASAIELSPDNWEAETSGKSVFLKFFAPWCGHCKKLKPDWDKLMDEFAGSATQLVADVDCTAGGKPLCDENGVKGYPTLKWGDPSDLQDYQGGRTLSDLSKFANEKLKPLCSVKNIDLCDADKKAEIEKYQAMDSAALEAVVAAEEKKLEAAEALFKAEVQKLQDTYTKLSEDKDKTIADVKASGLGLMKSVLKSASAGNDEL
mmetsp:Transcript_16211/g.35087  ORF Transcript_16211/g.35087 Transcript_16211/m.35087 type:complete len:218 (-) Transcript_16211:378-1031(-)